MTSPVSTAHLFRPLGAALIDLLRGLRDEDWSRSTSAPQWTVKDVVAHLLDVDLRRLSAGRDGHALTPPSGAERDYGALVAWLDTLNAQWISAARRLSGPVLIECLAGSTESVADHIASLDVGMDALFPVAWADVGSSPMWLDIGREYTERWHHQDQIREAVGAAPLRAREWLRPVLEISLLALPRAYSTAGAPAGTRIGLDVAGEAGGNWQLDFVGTWRLQEVDRARADAVIRVDDLHLARLLLHRLPGDVARAGVHIAGDADLAEPLLAARAVMV